MAKRKINKDEAKNQPLADNVHIKGAGSVQDEVITNTNYVCAYPQVDSVTVRV